MRCPRCQGSILRQWDEAFCLACGHRVYEPDREAYDFVEEPIHTLRALASPGSTVCKDCGGIKRSPNPRCKRCDRKRNARMKAGGKSQ